MMLAMDAGTIEVRVVDLAYRVDITHGVDITRPTPILVSMAEAVVGVFTETGFTCEVGDTGNEARRSESLFCHVLDTA
jgi:hypothetical protein